MPLVQIVCGDALSVIRSAPDNCVQCVITSPPYFGLRDYHAEGQIGLERSPEVYVERLIEVFREVRRVLRPDGTLWLNLATSYSPGKIQSEDYVLRDDLTKEELAHVYRELGRHFEEEASTLSEVW